MSYRGEGSIIQKQSPAAPLEIERARGYSEAMKRSAAVLIVGLLFSAAAARAQEASPDLPTMSNAPGGGLLAFSISSRENVLSSAEVPVLEPTTVIPHQHGDVAGYQSATGGGSTDGYSDLAKDRWVGTNGFASCVGAVIKWRGEDGKTKAIVSHFTVENSPGDTLANYQKAHKDMAIPAGAVAYIGGGDGSTQSNHLLAKTILALRERGVKVKSYAPNTSIFVNGEGKTAVSERKQADGYAPAAAGAAPKPAPAPPAAALERESKGLASAKGRVASAESGPTP